MVNRLPDDARYLPNCRSFQGKSQHCRVFERHKKQPHAKSLCGYSPEAAVHNFLQHQSSKWAARARSRERRAQVRACTTQHLHVSPVFLACIIFPNGGVAVKWLWQQLRAGCRGGGWGSGGAAAGGGGGGSSSFARIKENISSDNKEDQRTSKVTGEEGGGPAGGLTNRIPSGLRMCCGVFFCCRRFSCCEALISNHCREARNTIFCCDVQNEPPPVVKDAKWLWKRQRGCWEHRGD